MDIIITSDWLMRRSAEEERKIRSVKVNWVAWLLSSEKKLKEQKEEMTKSLGRMEMIYEILQNHNKKLKQDSQTT